MRLISLHVDTVRALERLRIPIDDLTPDGLWGSVYHLVGVTAEQRAVLDAWSVSVNDITPAMLAGAMAQTTPQLRDAWQAKRPAAEPRADARSEGSPLLDRASGWGAPRGATADDATVMSSEPKHHGDPLEREVAPAAGTDGAHAEGNGAAEMPARDPSKLRVSIGGKYRDASVKKGKILFDGQTYDTPAQATKSVAPAKGDWVFWEYFDAEAGKWRMLDRDWHPGAAT